MDNFDETLRQLMAEACAHPLSSVARQQSFHKIYRLVTLSGKLWKANTLDYADAVQEMWEYSYRHLEQYDPTICSVMTWLDDRLKKILRNFGDRSRRQQHKLIPIPKTDDGQLLDPIEGLAAPADAHIIFNEILGKTLQWIQTDPEGTLRRTVFRKRSDINAQVLLLRQLPPNTVSWDVIAAEFSLSSTDAKYLPQWYSRHCYRLLRDFGKSQGYLE